MTPVKITEKTNIGKIIAAICILGAVSFALYVEYDSYLHPTTDSGVIDADVVHVGAVVGGHLLHLPIKVNQAVHKGDLLYEIDPEPYQIAVHQAEAKRDLAQAQFEEQERLVSEKTSNAASSAQSYKKAQEERDLAARTVTRLRPLALKHYISWQEFDQAETQLKTAETGLQTARHNEDAAHTAIGDLKITEATLKKSKADLALAQYHLSQTKVYAHVNGYVASLTVKEGEILSANQPLFTLVANDEWFATANIREINLKPITPGACATVYSMIDRSTPMKGHVESIGWGVDDTDMVSNPHSVPYVERQMDWVHVSQRFPVRIHIDAPHINLLRMGATANIEILHGASCR